MTIFDDQRNNELLSLPCRCAKEVSVLTTSLNPPWLLCLSLRQAKRSTMLLLLLLRSRLLLSSSSLCGGGPPHRGASRMRRETFLFHLFVACLLVVLGLTSGVQAEPVLKQVHVVTRHGSGYMFDDGDPESNAVLTEYGQQQVYELGLYLHNKYKHNVLATYDPDRVELTSSDADRAIVTAQILAQVMFANSNSTTLTSSTVNDLPVGVQIPVYSTDLSNDVTIRAYAQCPKGIDLENLFRSKEWQNLQSDHMNLLQDLALKPEFQNFRAEGRQDDGHGDEHGDYVALTEIFEVFDAIFVAKEWCNHANATLDPATNQSMSCPKPVYNMANLLSDTDWKELENLAHAAETTKYDVNTAGQYAGVNLWMEILERAGGVVGANDKSNGFYLYSGHYATILGMFAALGQALPSSEQAIPNYASAFIVEVYYDDSKQDTQIKVLYKAGGAEHSTTINVVKCGSGDYCSRSTLKDLFSNLDIRKWCHQCGNDSANPCLDYLLEKTKEDLNKANDKCNASSTGGTADASASASAASTTPSSGPSQGSVVGAVLGGMVLGSLLTILVGYYCGKRTHNNHNNHNSNPDGIKSFDDVERSESPTNNTISPSGSEDPTDLTEVPINGGGPYVYT